MNVLLSLKRLVFRIILVPFLFFLALRLVSNSTMSRFLFSLFKVFVSCIFFCLMVAIILPMICMDFFILILLFRFLILLFRVLGA